MDLLKEQFPSSAINPIVPTVLAEDPIEQLTLTHDETDYLWYSTSIENKGNVTLNFSIASGDIYLRIFVNNRDVSFTKDQNNLVSANIDINLDSNSIDILFVSMGLQN